MPEVSVIIPTCNRCHLLRQAIDSVLCQTLRDLELLIVDDGSADGTRAMVESIPDERIRYLRQDNAGPSSARNRGLLNARGRFVAFLDSDDLWTDDYLEKMTSQLRKNPDYGVSYTATAQRHETGAILPAYRARYCVSGWVASPYWHKAFIFTSAIVIAASVLEGMFFDEELSLYEDGDFFLRLSTKTRFLYVASDCVTRRVQTNSLSQHCGRTKVDVCQVKVWERFYRHFGGDRFISERQFRSRMSRMYSKVGTAYIKNKDPKTASGFFVRAIDFSRCNVGAYIGLMRAAMMPSADEPRDIFEPLPSEIKPPRALRVNCL